MSPSSCAEVDDYPVDLSVHVCVWSDHKPIGCECRVPSAARQWTDTSHIADPAHYQLSARWPRDHSARHWWVNRPQFPVIIRSSSVHQLLTPASTSLSPSPPHHHHNLLTALFRDHPGEPVPEENFWTLRCKGRLTEADTPTIRLGATPSGLTCANLYHPPRFFTGRMPFLPPNQQCQSSEGN